MRLQHSIIAFFGFAALFGASVGHAFCPDAGPETCSSSSSVTTYLVREDCTGLDNCFESVAKLSGKQAICGVLTQDNSLGYGEVNVTTCATNGWLWGQRSPSDASPVVIDVGPGTFEPFVCPEENGHVTIRGAGRDQTKFLGATAADGGSISRGMSIFACDDLIVSELTAEGSAYGVEWIGPGEATWSRVDMIANTALLPTLPNTPAGWLDNCDDFGATSVQNVYDSRSIVTGPSKTGPQPIHNYAYRSSCAETYYFGGALINSMTGGGTNVVVHGGLSVNTIPTGAATPPSFFLFGTQIVSQPSRAITAGSGIAVGIDVKANAKVHIEDGSLRVRAEVAPGSTVNAVGIRTVTGGTVERFGTPLDVGTTSGSATECSPGPC